jgi:hypothetical protein
MIRIDRQQVSSPLDPGLVKRARSRIDQWFNIETTERHRQKPEFSERLSIGEQAQKALSELFLGKCAYCESPLGGTTSGEVDWFRPFTEATDLSGKGSADHYIWLFANWENLYLSCPSCTRSKRSLFPVEGPRARPLTPQDKIHTSERALLIDPCLYEPAEHLRFLETGMVEPRSRAGETTIKVLNLNRSDLLQARSEAWHQTWLAARRLGVDNDISSLFDRSKPYAAVVRAALEALRRELRPIPVRDYVPRQLAPERRTAEDILAHDEEAFRLTARPLRRIKITNFRALREVDLTFGEPSARHTPWLMLLGENATGKSTVLQAIALTLAGADEAQKYVQASKLPSADAFQGSVQIWFWDQDVPAELHFDRGSDRFEGTRGASAIVLGYGALRYVERRRRTFDSAPPFSQIAPLMEAIARIGYPGRWLLDLSEVQFETAARALQSVLPSTKDSGRRTLGVLPSGDDVVTRAIMRRSGSRIYFDDGHHRANLAQLSAGYQTIVGMCGDIMRLLFERWDTLSSAIAIVLIDELDAHLHPRWAMRIVYALREAFPQVQFVASTHDPLALRGLRSGEVALLRRNDEDEIVADQHLPPLEGMQVDQILTSRVFGLDSTVDPETETLLDEYYHLRSLPPDPAREARIGEIRARVGDREALGRSESEHLMLQAAAEFVRETSESPDARVALRAETLDRLREIAARGAATRRRRTE